VDEKIDQCDLTPYTFFFHVIKVDGSLCSGYIGEHFNDYHVFLLHVSMVDMYVIIVMSFIATVMVHISIVNVVRTFVH